MIVQLPNEVSKILFQQYYCIKQLGEPDDEIKKCLDSVSHSEKNWQKK